MGGNDNIVVNKPWNVHVAERERERRRGRNFLFGFSIFIIICAFFSFPVYIGIILIGIFLIVYWKRLFGRKKEHHHHHHEHHNHNNKQGFVKKYIIWFIAFTIGIVLAYLIRRIYLPDIKIIWLVILAGVLIEVCSKIMQIFVLRHKWIVDGHFLFWLIVQSGLFYLSYFIVEKVITPELIYSLVRSIGGSLAVEFILLGILQTILVHIIWKLNIEGRLFV
jgi:Ca2+/Na+ antiporter